MDYRYISADCHVDLCWLPYDLFVSNASHAMKDRMPYVTQGPDGPRWVTKSGLDLGFANGKGGTGALGMGRKVVAGTEQRAERLGSTGLFTDGAQGIFRPTIPELRLQDQERDGIQAEVLYGLNSLGVKLTDREASVEFYRIYNDWLSDFCSYDRRRFIGLAAIPCHNVDLAVVEARRAVELGLRGLEFAPFHGMAPLSNPYWDPFWKAADEMNLPVHFHSIGGTGPVMPLPENLPREFKEDLPDAYKQATSATMRTEAPLMMVPILASVIHGGALERFPDLRIVFAETGIGWIPFVLDRMDYEYEYAFKGRIPLKMKPSDYWHRQCRATFQFDRIGAKLLDDLGIENVMWGSDFPHFDGTFPDSQEYIRKQFGHLPTSTQRKITCENAAKFYGLTPA